MVSNSGEERPVILMMCRMNSLSGGIDVSDNFAVALCIRSMRLVSMSRVSPGKILVSWSMSPKRDK